jgi:hypothetical protein
MDAKRGDTYSSEGVNGYLPSFDVLPHLRLLNVLRLFPLVPIHICVLLVKYLTFPVVHLVLDNR